jgi:hypothetical protein
MMPPPLHVAAREAFNTRINDHLEASIAFPLFLVSEQESAAKWEREHGAGWTDQQYRDFHNFYLTPHEIGRYQENSEKVGGRIRHKASWSVCPSTASRI